MSTGKLVRRPEVLSDGEEARRQFCEFLCVLLRVRIFSVLESLFSGVVLLVNGSNAICPALVK